MNNEREIGGLAAHYPMPRAAILALSTVLGYLHNEEQDWNDNGRPADHIWPAVRTLRHWLLGVRSDTGEGA